jgi:hypothetical protein
MLLGALLDLLGFNGLHGQFGSSKRPWGVGVLGFGRSGQKRERKDNGDGGYE